jgi:hypothetical protein
MLAKVAGRGMRLAHGLGYVVLIAVVAVTSAAARDLPRRSVTPLEAIERLPDGYDPFRVPSPDRVPDDYVNGKPYWLPTPSAAAITREQASRPAASAMAADKLPDGYDPYRPPTSDRLPDDYVDGRPYWAPAGMQRLPSGLVVYPSWEAELGGRYFASSGRFQFDLFGFPPGTTNNILVSRLTYRNLLAHSGEVFGRVDHATGLFIKAYAGGGVISGGSVQDEDFPPAIVPYSSTNSAQRNGRLAYGAIDFGWAWRTRTLKTSFFAGYLHYSERLNAFGCTQTALSLICVVPPVSTSDLGIVKENNWDAVRLGFNTEWRMTDRWKLTTEVAWLPAVILNATDTHFHTFGTTLRDGADALTSVQLEAILSYYFTDAFSVGLGARYWNIHTGAGNATVHFETVGGFPQAATFKTERWGAFFQGSYKFGQLQPSPF